MPELIARPLRALLRPVVVPLIVEAIRAHETETYAPALHLFRDLIANPGGTRNS